MPQLRQFKKGSIIYFDSEAKNNFAYLFKSGSLTRIKLSTDTGMPERSKVQVGEFFGIKAALGVLPRDETIQVDSDTAVFQFTPKEFEDVIKKNLSIIFKMLRAFSNELRRVHHAIENILHTDGDGDLGDSASRLQSIGNYYFSQKQYKSALYALQKYLEHYPDASGVEESRSQIEMIKDVMSAKGESFDDTPAAEKPADQEPADAMDMPGGDDEVPPLPEEVADDPLAGLEEEPPPPPPPVASPGFKLGETKDSYEVEKGDQTIHKAWSEIAFVYAKKEWARCDAMVEKIVAALKGQTPAGSLFEKLFLARCRLKFYQHQHDHAIAMAKEFVKAYKGSKFTWCAMVVIAEAYGAMDQLDHARAVFGKIAQGGDAPLKVLADKRLAELG